MIVRMANTDGRSGGSDRQLEFLREAFGLSEAEAKEVLEEYESFQNRSEPNVEEAGMEVDDIDSERLGQLLDALWDQRERTENQLEDDNFEKATAESAVNSESTLSAAEVEQIEARGFDVVTVDGQEMVPADQLYNWLVDLDGKYAEAQRSIEQMNAILDEYEANRASVPEIDFEEEREHIEDQWQRINRAKERAGIDTDQSNQ
jgi:ABC-type Fe3+-hydroxamate transport system substrate-binding protein